MPGQIWMTGSLGGYLFSPKLSQQMREQANPMYTFRQFVDIKEAFGANKGDTVVFDKQLRIDTRGGTLTETNTMPKNRIKFTTGSLVVSEYGNGVDYSQKVDTLAEFNMKDRFQVGLVNDQKDVLDRAVATQFQSAKLKAVATNTATTSFYTNGTATGNAGASISDKNWRQIVDQMGIYQIPKWKNGDHYMAILSVKSMSGVYEYLQAVAQYADPEFRFKNEIGKYYACRGIMENNVLSNALNSSYGEAVFFGDEAVVEAVALPEELRYEETDVGRSKTLAWYAILGFKMMWDSSVDNLNSNINGLNRIIHVTTA